MPLYLSNIDAIVRLYTLPFSDEGGLCVLGDLGKTGRVERTTLKDVWLNWIEEAVPVGYSMDQAQSQFEHVWEQDDKIDLLRFYRKQADLFLEPEGGHLLLRLDGRGVALGFNQVEMMLFWHLFSIRIGPDFLPALRTAFLPPSIAQALLANDMAVDEISDRALSRLLSKNNAVDCHAHFGSSFRYSLFWEDILNRFEESILGNDLPMSYPAGAGYTELLASVLPSVYYCVLARRILDLAELGLIWSLWEVTDTIDTRVDLFGKELRSGSKDWTHEKILVDQHVWIHDHLVITKSAFMRSERDPRPEPEFMVAVIRKLEASPPKRGDSRRFARLWWGYIHHKAKVHYFLTQGYDVEGLRRFQKIFARNRMIDWKKLEWVMRDPQQRRRHLAPLGGVAAIEVRSAPTIGSLHTLIDCAARLDREEDAPISAPGLSVVAHFVKKSSNQGKLREPTYRQFILLQQQMRDLQTLAEICYREGILDQFVGLDVAGAEMAVPNWFYLPAFVEFRHFWRNSFLHSSLGYTFHAGEDFLHLSQGLRHIAEIVQFFPWENGDRIGHGLALGISPSMWIKQHPLIVAPLEVQLFDRIWEWSIIREHGLACAPHVIHQIEREIERLGCDLFRDIVMPNLSCSQWLLFYEGLYCPLLVLELLNYSVIWEGQTEYRQRDAQRIRKDADVMQALRIYLNNRHEFSYQAIHYPILGNFEDEVQRHLLLQEWLVGEIAKRGYVVEMCPTSNLSIRNMGSLVHHPLINLLNKIKIVICTDNVSTFNSNLRNEYGRIFLAMKDQARLPDDMLREISHLIENSRLYSFIR